jgi:hypothetical protein
MNGIRKSGVGVALALAAAPGFAQQPSPAGTLGKVVAVGDAPSGPVVRAAAPDNRPTSLFPSPSLRAPSGQPPAGGTFPQPKPAEGQPNVTESRTPPNVPPQPTQPGTPFLPGANYPQHVMPGAYPPPAPNYVPSHTAPGSAAFPVQGPPVVSGPVVGGAMTGCDPYTGAGTLTTPVSPSVPGIGGYDAGLYTYPTPAAPYWGGGWDPLFPRARTAVSSVVAPFTQGRLVLGAEYLLWFARAQDVPPLLTTSSPGFNGIIGQGDTQVLYGNTAATNTQHNGARFSAAYWLNDLWAIDGNVWFLAKNSGGFSADSTRYPTLARPFVSANTGANFSQLVAAPGLATGAAVINNDSLIWV